MNANDETGEFFTQSEMTELCRVSAAVRAARYYNDGAGWADPRGWLAAIESAIRLPGLSYEQRSWLEWKAGELRVELAEVRS